MLLLVIRIIQCLLIWQCIILLDNTSDLMSSTDKWTLICLIHSTNIDLVPSAGTKLKANM